MTTRPRTRNTSHGKAYEYACLLALKEALDDSQPIRVEGSQQLRTACTRFLELPTEHRERLMSSASAAATYIIRLEPQLENPSDNTPLYLSLQSDARGQAGDVRDVLCLRKQNGWEIGISCKHNHYAVKHSRLSQSIDFGKQWFDRPCSPIYFAEIAPLFHELAAMRAAGTLWSSVNNKAARFYTPLLRAFLAELKRLDKCEPGYIPERLIHYLMGQNDFYKVIAEMRSRTTRILAFNINGTLNRPAGSHRSLIQVPKLKCLSSFITSE